MEKADILVLCLDDNQVFLDTLKIVMDDVNVKYYTNSTDFFAAWQPNVFVAIVDYYLSEPATGKEIVRQIVKRNQHCYIIGMSNTDNKDEVVDFFNAGLDKFVDKNRTDFIHTLKGHITEGIDYAIDARKFWATLGAIKNNRELWR